MFTIEVTYQTGDSFNSYEETHEIGLMWNNIELANEALSDLSEHYKLFQEREGYGRTTTNEDIYKRAKKCRWYQPTHDRSVYDNENDWSYVGCMVEMDDGSYKDIPTNDWCGYFETLRSAKIIIQSHEVTF